MQRLDLEFLLAITAHRRTLHRQYDARDPQTVSRVVRDYHYSMRVDPAALHVMHRTYETGNIEGRWKVYRETQRVPPDVT